MSTIVPRETAKHGVRYRVMFRVAGRLKAVSFETEEHAQRWKDLLDSAGYAIASQALEAQAPAIHERTVSQQVAHHIDHLTAVEPGTLSDYRSYLNRHIDPYIGHLPISLLSRDHVSQWVKSLAEIPLASKTIKHRHALLSAALKGAVRDGLILTNVAEGVRMPRDDHDKEMVTLNADEVLWFVQCAPPQWQKMIITLIGTGMRFGEVTALTVGDIDVVNRTARIHRAWKHTDGNGHKLGRPKSTKSTRTVHLGGIVEVLRPLLEGRGASEFVFTNGQGGPVRRSNFFGEAWTPTVRAFAGDTARKLVTPRGRRPIVWTQGPGKRLRVHDARHTYASIKIKEGRSMAWLQMQLGHESIDTTIRTYTHLQTADLAGLGDVIDWTALAIER